MSVEIKEQLETGLKALRDLVDEKAGKQSEELDAKIEAAAKDVESKYLELEKSNKDNEQRVKDLEEQIYNSAKGQGVDDKELKSFNSVRQSVASSKKPVTAEGYKLYKSGLDKWMRKGLKQEFFSTHLEPAEQKAIQESVDAQGGYLVPPDFQAKLETILVETSPMRQLADVVTIGGDRWQQPFDPTRFGVTRSSEAATEAVTSNPGFALVEIPVFPRIAKPLVTGEMLEDAVYDLEGYVRNTAAEDISFQENTDFVSGDGVQKPKGFLSYASGNAFGQIERVSSAGAGALTWADLLSLMGGLKTGYHANSAFVMSRTVWFNLLKEQTSTGGFKFSFGANGVSINEGSGPGFNFLGRPVILFEDMPAVATGANPVALADWKKAYKVIDRSGVSVLADPYTGGDNVTIFRISKRTGGGVYNSDSIKLLNIV